MFPLLRLVSIVVFSSLVYASYASALVPRTVLRMVGLVGLVHDSRNFRNRSQSRLYIGFRWWFVR